MEYNSMARTHIDIPMKIITFILTFVVALTAFFGGMCFRASAVTWDDFNDDVNALVDAYFDYFNSWTGGYSANHIFESAADIPLSWLEVIGDGLFVLSPIDNIYYALTDNGTLVYTGDDSVKSLDNWSSADDFAPVLPADVVEPVLEEFNDLYVPYEPNLEGVLSYRYQNYPVDLNSSGYWHILYSGLTYYTPDQGFFGAGADGFVTVFDGYYLLPFYADSNGDIYYSDTQFRLYFEKTDDGVAAALESNYIPDGDTFSVVTPTVHTKGGVVGIDPYYVRLLPSFDGNVIVNMYDSYSNFVTSSDPFSGRNIYYLYYSFHSSSDFSVGLSGSLPLKFYPDSEYDFGYLYATVPFTMSYFNTIIDVTRLPDNCYYTISGDTIWDYSIVDYSTGDTSSISEYVTNNYSYVTNNYYGDDNGSGNSGGDTVDGNVGVSGNVDVSGDIIVGGQVDINVNFSGSSDVFGSVTDFDEPESLHNWFVFLIDLSEGVRGFLGDFFGFLPGDIVIILGAGLTLVVLARVLGR